MPDVFRERPLLGDGGTTDGIDQGDTAIDHADLKSIHMAPYLPGGDLGEALGLLGAPSGFTVGRLNSLALIGRRDGSPALYSTGAVEASVGIGDLPVVHDAAIGLLGAYLERETP